MSYTQFVIDLDNMLKNLENTFTGFPFLTTIDTNKNINKVTVPNIPFDLYKTEDTIFVDVAIPGKTKEDVTITSERISGVNYLKVSVTSEKKKEEQVQVIQKKIKDISGEITIKIGDSWKLKDLTATVENGLLSIKVPKKSEKELESSIRKYEIK